MKNILNLLKNLGLKRIRIELDASNENIKLTGPLTNLTEEDKQLLIRNKPEIIRFLNFQKSKTNLPPITPDENKEPFKKLAPNQDKIWIHEKFFPKSTIYTIPVVYEITELKLDYAVLEKALKILIEKNAILRTVFVEQEGEPVAKVLDAALVSVPIQIENYSTLNKSGSSVQQLFSRHYEQAFDLEQGPLFRFIILEGSEKTYQCLFLIHHIISDAWTLDNLFRSLFGIYSSLIENKPVEYKVNLQYSDYVKWLYNHAIPNPNAKAYWQSVMKDYTHVPLSFIPEIKQNERGFHSDSLNLTLEKDLFQAITQFCGKEDISVFNFTFTAISILLHKYSGASDFVVGMAVAGRNHPQIQSMIGYFANVLPVRLTFGREEKLTELWSKVAVQIAAVMDNEYYPVESIWRQQRKDQKLGNSNLYQVMISSSDIGHSMKDEIKGKGNNAISLNRSHTITDLVFVLREATKYFVLTCEYDTDLFSKNFIKNFLNNLKELFKTLIASPDQAVTAIHKYISSEEYQKLSIGFNQTRADYPKDETFISLLQEKLPQFISFTAVECKGEKLSYDELDNLSSRFANFIKQEYNIQEKATLAVQLTKNTWIPVSIWGILKTGGIYLPLDPNIPKERVSYIIKDSNCSLLIDETIIRNFIGKQNQYADHFISPTINSNDLAYVIYTSGTTGTPKGVGISHSALMNLCNWHKEFYEVTDQSKASLYASISFDASIIEMFPYWISGACVEIIDNDIRTDFARLTKHINTNNITHCFIPTPVLQELLQTGYVFNASLKVLVGGDALKNIPTVPFRLYDNYGPSECAVISAACEVNKDDILNHRPLSIGKPISNTRIYILNEELDFCPVGVKGQICIAGTGLSQGYIHNKTLTDEKFIVHPVLKEKIYLTGDLGYWSESGDIFYAGRNDEQVKIRGYRVETAEIEQVMLSGCKVENVIVLLREISNRLELVAYYTAKTPFSNYDEVKTVLRKKLPEYMVPSYYILLQEIPFTTNGKINKEKLLAIPLEKKEALTLPATPLQQKLAAVWSKLLGHEQIGMEDNFFELGGHSLKANQLVVHIRKNFEVEITIRDIFNHPVFAQLSGFIEQNKQQRFQKIQALPKQEFYPVSDSQKRLWILNQLSGQGSTVYNIPVVCKFDGDFNSTVFEKSIEFLIQRHEVLRTSFYESDSGDLLQKITDEKDVAFKLTYIHADNDMPVEKIISGECAVLFDLEKGPLLKASSIRIDENKHVVIFVIHHIICDGWSMKILVNEILQIYNSLLNNKSVQLPELTIHYKDYSVWLNDQLTSGVSGSKNYWISQFANNIPVLELPTDRPRPLIQTYTGKTLRYTLSPDKTAAFKKLLQQKESTLFMGLISVLNILFYRYSGLTDIVLGSPVSGRIHADIENQIGFYVNTLALRTWFASDITFNELLQNVKENVLAAYSHQEYPFDRLVEELKIKRDLSRNPLFDVMISLQNLDINLDTASDNNGFENLRVTGIQQESTISKFDLTFTFIETANHSLLLSIEYNTDLFDKWRIDRFAEHIGNVIKTVTEDADQPIDRLSILSEDEKQVLIHQFGYNGTIEDKKFKEINNIIDFFEKNARNNPENIALIIATKQFTYKELKKTSDKLAHYLVHEQKIENEDRVSVKLERNEWLIISLLAVLKSGAAYIPVDIAYPEERIRYIEENSHSKLTIDQAFIHTFLESDADGKSRSRFVRPIINRHQLAYIIYTSGSTGKPKGVMIEHHNAIRFIQWAQYEFDASLFDVVYATTSHCFDLSVFEIFYTLSVGKTIRLLSSALDIENTIYTDRNILLNTVPSVVSTLVENNISFDRVKVLNIAGEPLPPSLVKKLDIHHTQVRNLYGPSEDTTYSSVYHINDYPLHTVSIGKPVLDTHFYILDQHLQLVPQGVAGEIYISGQCLSRGYYNQPQLTSERFIANPFLENEQMKMYKTGDLARWLPDGNIEFYGRTDSQVKVRGYRIELGEIDNVIQQQCIEIAKSVTTVKEIKNEKFIVSFITKNSELDKAGIQNRLRGFLPEYMMPAYFVELPEIPLSPNGKIERNLLVFDGENEAGKNRVNDTIGANQLEKDLLLLWQEILGNRNISTTDNFFELGGHSLKVMLMVKRLKERSKIHVKPQDIFNHPSIAQLTRFIGSSATKPERDLPPVTKTTAAVSEADAIQKSIWSHCMQSDEVNASYNIPAGIYIKEELDTERLHNSIKQLVKKYEILRTVFQLEEGTLLQKVLPPDSLFCQLTVYTPEDEDKIEQFIEELVHRETGKGMDLDKGPLFKINVVRINSNKYYVLVLMHHIISDAQSMQILFDQLAKAYAGAKETALSFQHKDFSQWHNTVLNADEWKKAEQYWKKQMQSKKPALPYLQGNNKTIRSGNLRFTLNRNTADFLKEELGHDTTDFMIYVSFISTALYKLTGEYDFLLGVPCSVRSAVDLQDQIGCYINTLPLRISFDPGSSIRNMLLSLKKEIPEVFENTLFPSSKIIQASSNNKRNTGGAVFNAIVDLISVDGNKTNSSGIFEATQSESVFSKYDLCIYIFSQKNHFDFHIEYNANRISKDTVEYLKAGICEINENIQNILTKPVSEAVENNEELYLPQMDMEV